MDGKTVLYYTLEPIQWFQHSCLPHILCSEYTCSTLQCYITLIHMITALIYFAPYFMHEGYNTDTEYAHSTLQCYIITPIHMISVLK